MKKISKNNYIIATKRSAVTPRNGAFAALDIHELCVPIIQKLFDAIPVTSDSVDELIAANALGAGGNPARLIALASGFPQAIAGLSIDRQCCGGLDAILLANDMLTAGTMSVVIAGGAESYSRRPKRLRKTTHTQQEKWQEYEQPAFTPWPERDPAMSVAADTLAQTLNISVERQHDWAVISHQKSLAAQPRLAAEIVPLVNIHQDTYTRKLTPKVCHRAANIVGSISTANTAVAADGVAFSLIVNEQTASQYNGAKLRIVSGCTVGADPCLPGLAPVPAIYKALAMAGISIADVQCAEIMEAYAVQAIACIEQVGIDPAICNIGGGALSRGHPIGASGAILMTRLFTELQFAAPKNKNKYGLAAIAAAGGLGTAVIVEYIEG